MYNPITNKFVISRDIMFMEDKSWNEIANGTCHNPFVVFDEAPTTNLPRLQVQTESISQFGTDSDKTYGSASDSDKNQRMISLSDIYVQDDDNLLRFAFLSFQPACFEEVVKEKKWVDAMNNGILNEEVYVHQPPGFKVKEQENKLKEPTLYIKEDRQDSDFTYGMKNTFGYVFLFGKNLISWVSKKQTIVEYVVVTNIAAWLKRLLLDFG